MPPASVAAKGFPSEVSLRRFIVVSAHACALPNMANPRWSRDQAGRGHATHRHRRHEARDVTAFRYGG